MRNRSVRKQQAVEAGFQGQFTGWVDKVSLGMVTWKRKDFEMPQQQAYQITFFPSLSLSFPFVK